MGVVSVVCGILSLIVGLFINSPIGLVLAVVAIVFGAIGKKQGKKCAVGGLVCGIIAAAIVLTVYIACLACAKAANDVVGSLK